MKLLLLLIILFSANAVIAQSGSLQPTIANQDAIIIWKVGSPHQDEIPDTTVPLDLRIIAKQQGVQLKIVAFPAKGFADKYFDAVLENKEPDILAFNNYGILQGITTKLGSFTGIATSPRVKKTLISVSQSFDSLKPGGSGWVYLISTSKNHLKAKLLALSKLECDGDESEGLQKPSQGLVSEITPLALAATRAYYAKDVKKLRDLSGSSDIKDVTDTLQPSYLPMEIKEMCICEIWGNDRLIFANVYVLSEGAKILGRKKSFVILRKVKNNWELLSLSGQFTFINELSRYLPSLTNTSKATLLQPLTLLNPLDKAQFKRFPESETPMLEWSNSGNDVSAYIIESQFDFQSNWSESNFRLFAADAGSGKTIKVKAPFRSGAQPHRWRIWAMGKDGQIVISEWRTIEYMN